MDADRLIRKTLGVKHGDSLPFKGWSHRSTRLNLYEIFAALGYQHGAEIGVAEGRNAIDMLAAVPSLHLTCVDPWRGYGRYSQELCDRRYELATKNLAGRNVTIMRMTSLEASQQVENGSLDFVYIDGDHRFDAVMMDIILWAPKVRRGGIIAGHDAYFFYQAGVVDAVMAYTRAHRINDWYVTWEKEATWFWVQKESHA